MTHRLLGNDGQYVQNAELLRKVQLEWPRRVVKRLWRSAFVLPMAYLRLGMYHALWNVARGAANLLARLASRANAGMQRAWYIIDPYVFTGEAENFMAQRKYDSLALWYDAVDADRRNAMVPSITDCYPAPRPLQDGYGAEIYHA